MNKRARPKLPPSEKPIRETQSSIQKGSEGKSANKLAISIRIISQISFRLSLSCSAQRGSAKEPRAPKPCDRESNQPAVEALNPRSWSISGSQANIPSKPSDCNPIQQATCQARFELLSFLSD